MIVARRYPIASHERRSTLSISVLAQRTGVPQGTLRTWEARHGFPEPVRLPGGHRRYAEETVEAVSQVLRLRASGLALEVAIRRVLEGGSAAGVSVFAELRRRHPELVPHLLSPSLMLALSRAIEDECCAQAQRPILFASFQEERFYRASQPRWTELARTARSAVVLAAFASATDQGSRPEHQVPLEVSLPADAPMNREWAIVCDAPDYPACLVGWERPGQREPGGRNRRFEALWTVDPQAVREAARVFARLTDAYRPDAVSAHWSELGETPPPASPDLQRATSLMNRMLSYLASATRPRGDQPSRQAHVRASAEDP